ncbi:uncharacterized protein LOC120343035 [Styela clava]
MMPSQPGIYQTTAPVDDDELSGGSGYPITSLVTSSENGTKYSTFIHKSDPTAPTLRSILWPNMTSSSSTTQNELSNDITTLMTSSSHATSNISEIISDTTLSEIDFSTSDESLSRNTVFSANSTVLFETNETNSTSLSDVQPSPNSASAPLLVVVAIIAFVTLLLLFIGMIRYRFCKRASYYINEAYDMDKLYSNSENKPLKETDVPPTSVCGERGKQEWLV